MPAYSVVAVQQARVRLPFTTRHDQVSMRNAPSPLVLFQQLRTVLLFARTALFNIVHGFHIATLQRLYARV